MMTVLMTLMQRYFGITWTSEMARARPVLTCLRKVLAGYGAIAERLKTRVHCTPTTRVEVTVY